MTSNPSNQPIIHPVGIKNTERWTVYYRLQELGIPCICSTNQPLKVQLDNPSAIAQLCSVVKHSTGSRPELINWLNNCWQICLKRSKRV